MAGLDFIIKKAYIYLSMYNRINILWQIQRTLK